MFHPPHGEPPVLRCTVAWVYSWWTISRPWTLRHPVLRMPCSSMIHVAQVTRAGRALRQPRHGHAARPDASSQDKREERGCHASSPVHLAPQRAHPPPSSVCRMLLCTVGRNRAPPDAVSRRRHRVCPAGHRIDLPRVPPPPTSPLQHPVLRSPAPARHIVDIEPQQGRRPPLLPSAILRTTSTPPEPKNRTLGEPSSLLTTSPVHPGGELAGFWTSSPAGVPGDYIAELPGCLGCFSRRRLYL
jgi:hypothetical protein